MEYDKAVQEIIRFKETFDNIDIEKYKNPAYDLVGILGEYYALSELQARGYTGILYKLPQSGYDIHLTGSNTRVEVRTSLVPKSENIYNTRTYRAKDYPIEIYGWTVLKRKEEAPRYDALIGVAIDSKTFKNPKYYIFDQGEINQIDEVNLSWPKNVKKKIHIFSDEQSYRNALLAKPEIITKYERHINENKDQFIDKWNKIKN